MATLVFPLLLLLGLGARSRAAAGHASDFSANLVLTDDPSARVNAASANTHDPAGRPLFGVDTEGLTVEFSLTNRGDEPMMIVLHQTPLASEASITTNFFGRNTDIFHGGIVAEDVGSFGSRVLIQPSETITNHALHLGPTTLLAVTSGTVEFDLSFELHVVDPDTDRDLFTVAVRSNSVTLHVSQAAGRAAPEFVEPGPGGESGAARRQRSLNAAASSVAVATSTHPGVPYWNYVCADDESQHGWTCGGGGEKCACDWLKNNGYCSSDSSVRRACALSCGACEGASKWTKPWETKKFTTSGNCRSMSQINTGEALKDQFCANMLYCLEKKTADCDAAVKKWFGGTHTDTTEWTTLRNGFAKICSATNYMYQCKPAAEHCTITFAYNGQQYNKVVQGQVSQSVIDGFITQCQSSQGCVWGGTIAWVYIGQTSPREMNLCPIGFWIQDDKQSPWGSTKAGIIVHELSHFVDIAATDDLDYDAASQIAKAKSNPWAYLDNAATWDNLSEDEVHGTHTWASFSSGQPVDGGWTSWGSCSKPCGAGTKSRTCTSPSPSGGGDACTGSSSTSCNEQKCPCADNEWKCDSGECISAAYHCDGHKDHGTATWAGDCSDQSDEKLDACCALGGPAYAGTAACASPIDGGWTSWSSCTKACGSGTKSRTCTSPSPSNGGDACTGSSSTSCNEQKCPAESATTPAPTNDYDGAVARATLERYPGYTGDVLASGSVAVEQLQGGALRLLFDMGGLEGGVVGGLHIHSGTSCDAASLVEGHYYATETDPWVTHTSSGSGTAYTSSGSGTAQGSFNVDCGLDLGTVAGHAVVAHDKAGARILCGVLGEPRKGDTSGTDTDNGGGVLDALWSGSAVGLIAAAAAAVLFLSCVAMYCCCCRRTGRDSQSRRSSKYPRVSVKDDERRVSLTAAAALEDGKFSLNESAREQDDTGDFELFDKTMDEEKSNGNDDYDESLPLPSHSSRFGFEPTDDLTDLSATMDKSRDLCSEIAVVIKA